MNDEELMTRKEAALRLRISVRELDRKAGSGLLQRIKLGKRTTRFIRSNIESFIVQSMQLP